MKKLPVFRQLDIVGYGLYPGSDREDPGLHVRFDQGLTLILGANGLGKTTLVTMLYRMLTGPFDIPALADAGDLGFANLEPRALQPLARGTFKFRVADGARSAIIRLSFLLGSHQIIIERRLDDLQLVTFSIDHAEVAATEDAFQKEISKRAEFASFGDWILVLRYLVFFFEDRRTIVWDASAQRQLLRVLFLEPNIAEEWTRQERDILELDSRSRNLSAAIFKEEKTLVRDERKAKNSPLVLTELASLEDLQTVDLQRRGELTATLTQQDEIRQDARSRVYHLERERESSFRELERSNLAAIQAQFPSSSESASYIIAQLVTDEDCVACESHVPAVAKALRSRIASKKCVVCGSPRSVRAARKPIADAGAANGLRNKIGRLDKELGEAGDLLSNAQHRYHAISDDLERLRRELSQRGARIDTLIRLLPPEEAKLHEQRTQLASLRDLVRERQLELTKLRHAFKQYVERNAQEIVVQSKRVASTFDAFASGFLLESCRLLWSPQKAPVGQSGEQIEYPGFQLELTGSNFATPVRRVSADQVSESQREFLDLSFRMALMTVTCFESRGAMVIDAPESSLDAVFSVRAADVLARFAMSRVGNRLIVTSNLVDSQIIPNLMAKTTTRSGRERYTLINLIDEAEPTAAVRENLSAYRRVMTALRAAARRLHTK